jgi:hypothetical protein
MEKQRSLQENELHKKLSNLKKKRLNDLAKEHELEQKEYDRRCKEMQTDGPIGKNITQSYRTTGKNFLWYLSLIVDYRQN